MEVLFGVMDYCEVFESICKGDIKQFGNKLHLFRLFVSIWNISVSIKILVYGILAY